MAIEIVDFPMKNDGSFHSYVNVYQRVMFRPGLVALHSAPSAFGQVGPEARTLARVAASVAEHCSASTWPHKHYSRCWNHSQNTHIYIYM